MTQLGRNGPLPIQIQILFSVLTNTERTKQLTLSQIYNSPRLSTPVLLKPDLCLILISAARILGSLCLYCGKELRSFAIFLVTICTIESDKLS